MTTKSTPSITTTDTTPGFTYEPTLMPEHFASPSSRETNDKIDRKNLEDRTAKIARETTLSAQAAQAMQPQARPTLLTNALTGSAEAIWGPILRRELGSCSRVTSRLQPREAGKTSTAILEAALDAGRKREAIPEDLAEQLAEVAGTGRLIEASRDGAYLAGSMTAARLSSEIKARKKELEAAAHQDLAALVADAAQVARELEGVDSADVAIRRGQSAVIAWGLRDGLRERMVSIAKDLHYIRRATTSGFGFVRGGSPDRLAQGGEVSFASTWARVDELLEKLNANDATTDLLVGR
ncbi:hypothetical protein AXK56_09210 [Tsukamurella pulmonis]|uniref:Uncharacterized protein n=1 Tax=Tsukamurella pulmonis TaxID=47312 RepID=A0A1H1BMW1_9ACTN|nr:hypothetical protein [Tsukamurella pulmonis]KXO90275.1 hypothetical protein AXK56_09210 [Tsukamurella pulmonis]SDQ53209.1 hypothetical protein SAMN04489765_0769 [Tsukamurella pulmonis]SUP24880.1 Uncharacterised protein [Tsukamurella pulmonis]